MRVVGVGILTSSARSARSATLREFSMPLKPDTLVGPYQILGPLGAGGMGEVYKAQDTRLDRIVAIKVLPEHIASSSQAKQRFEREARAIAALKHPRICVLYDVGQHDGIDFLVMEFLEGETLAQRLEDGPLPFEEAMRIALEIADGLDNAHRSGFIHRDLKPGNVMLTPQGTKLLDFGLAKPGGNGVSIRPDAPTRELSVTGAGVILGTLQYMAPEQIEGHEADARTDIFAFGAVLYEMLTGRRAFEGKSQPSLMSAILSSTPPAPSAMAPRVPTAVDHVIERCLAKDPADRWHSVRDVLMELKWAGDPAKRAQPPGSARTLRVPILISAAVLVALVAAALFSYRPADRPAAASEKRFEIPVTGMASPFYISLSPDGQRVAYIAATAGGKTAIWVRPLNSLDAQMLPGTEGASPPDWSPDSRFIVFSADGKVKKKEIAGGPPQVLADLNADTLGRFTRSTWGRDGTIVFGVNDGRGLRKVSENGGAITEVTTLDRALEQTAHNTPWFLPDGRHFLYTAWSSKPENREVFIGSIDSKTSVPLLKAQSKAVYVEPGFILFLRDRVLMARPFDADRLQFTGDAAPVAEEVAYNSAFGQASFYPSNEGTLLYYRSSSDTLPSGSRQMFWINRSGETSGPLGGAAPVGANAPTVRLSPDGKRVAFHESSGGNVDVSIFDIERNLTSRLTANAAQDSFPVWSPGGEAIVFYSLRSAIGLYEKPSNGAVAERLLLESGTTVSMFPRDWSSDGKTIIFERRTGSAEAGAQIDIWALPLEGERKPVPYLATTDFSENQPALSPNGRWIAYVSNEDRATPQVIVRPFPDPSEGKWQISTSGGTYPRWRRDGRELYYLDRERRIVAVSVTGDAKFEPGKVTPLFTTPIPFPTTLSADIPYDVTPDGQRFLISASLAQSPAPTTTPVTVILNWPSVLKR
jgi:Tol biopolymer transport system component